MAKRKNASSSSGSTLLTLGVLGVAGYFAYEWFFAAPATAAASGLPADAFPFPGNGAAPFAAGQIVPMPNGQQITIPVAGNYYAFYGPNEGQWYLSTTAPTSAQIAAAQAFGQTAADQQLVSTIMAWQKQGTSGALSSSTGTSASGSTGTPATPATPAITPSGQTLDSIYQTLISSIPSADVNFTGTGSNLTGDTYHFNTYLSLAAPSLTIPTLPSSWNYSAPVTAAAYWAVMAPALAAANPSAGLSGLGCYGGAGAYLAGLGAYAW